MKLEEIRTKEDFMNYMKDYGTHVEFCIFDYYTIRKQTHYSYVINFYKEKHRANWCNNSKIIGKEKYFCSEECVDFIKNEVRKRKLTKLKLLVKHMVV